LDTLYDKQGKNCERRLEALEYEKPVSFSRAYDKFPSATTGNWNRSVAMGEQRGVVKFG